MVYSRFVVLEGFDAGSVSVFAQCQRFLQSVVALFGSHLRIARRVDHIDP